MRQIIAQQADGLKDLMALVEIVNNPKLIKAAAEESRKEFELTEQEKTKAKEARDAIKKLDSMMVDLEAQKTVINSAREQNEKLASDLADKKIVLDRMEFDANQKDIALSKREDEVSNLEKALSARMAAADFKETKNAEDSARLKELEASLKTRLQKVELRERAADL